MKKFGFLGATALRSAAVIAALGAAAMPAQAQVLPESAQDEPQEVPASDDMPAIPTTPQVAQDDGAAIVVTGSRIRRSEFNSPDPITIIDPALAQAQGQFNTAEMIQSSPIASGSSQVTSAISSAFVTNGGPGAETISLRGLGAERTLVLLNGRRAGPAGTRGAISSFDLNVLPQSIVQSVEILKTGASSVYGSDAIAGVVNLITKRNTNGLELDGFVSVPEQGGGEQYRLSATWGKDFGNGHIMVSADYFKRQPLRRADRDYLNCPEEYIFTRDGQRADLVDPRTGQFRCNDTVWGHNWVYTSSFGQAGRWQYSYPGDNLGAHIPLRNPANPFPNFVTPPGFYQVGYDRASTAVDNAFHPFMGRESIIPETDRYTFYVDGAYNITDNIEFGIEGLYNRRETKSTGYRQFYYLTGYTNNFPGSPGDPFSPGWEGPFFLSPTAITDHFDSSQSIDYYRGLAYVNGDFGGILDGWGFNGYYTYSRSEGSYYSDIIFADAVNLHDYRTSSCVGTNTPVSNRPCIDVDWTQPEFLRGNLTDAERAFLFGGDTGNTVYTQQVGEFSVAGPLFRLPAGLLQTAVGVSWRRDEINDIPGEQTRIGNSWGLTSAGITAGNTVTTEAFGEVEIPIFYNTPGIRRFTLSGSGRITSVSATRASDGVSSDDNGNWTYSVGANWEVTDWLRFRGRYGTSFRAPALFEQFLASQSSFLSQRQVDPCIQWAANLANNTINQRLADNCAAGTGRLPGVPGTHSGAGVSATIIQGGGLGVLESETSTAKSASVVLTPRFSFLPNTRLSIAVDYFDIEIEGEIATLSAGQIISGCYNSEFFPNEPLCNLFSREPAGVSGAFNIDTVQATFININRQRNEGIDLTVNLEQGLGRFGKVSLVSQMTWQFRDEVELFSGTVNDNTGEAGEPRWVGDFNLVYQPNDTLSLFYGLDVIGQTDDDDDYIAIYGDLCRTTATYGEFCVDMTAEARFYHSFSATKKLDGFDITMGVSNLFDQKPPRTTISGSNSLNAGLISTVGRSVFASQYDYLGRRFFMNVKTRF